MNVIYYTEINLVCIIILLLFRNHLQYKAIQSSTAWKIFNQLILVTVLFCLADMVAEIFRGQLFYGANFILELSNLIYYETLAVISYLWMQYAFLHLETYSERKKRNSFIYAIPLIAFTLLAISNPFTHIFFSIDENNLYVRNFGIYFHWAVTWLYLSIPTVKAIRVISHEKNKLKRQEIMPLLKFCIAPAIASVIQMSFYGVSSTQVGITISIVMICLTMQRGQLLMDALTGLNNRRAFDNYLEKYLLHDSKQSLTLIMIDVNGFKLVNDRYGHLAGDRALNDAADALRHASEEMTNRLFLYRYGGDEFVIAGIDCSHEEIAKLETMIHREMGIQSQREDNPYTLAVSVGVATGICTTADEIDQLLHMADEAMYDNKKCAASTKA